MLININTEYIIDWLTILTSSLIEKIKEVPRCISILKLITVFLIFLSVNKKKKKVN